MAAKEVGAWETSEFELLAAKVIGSRMAEGSFRNPEIVNEELFETDQPELLTSHDDALEAPTKYESKTALSQEVLAVLELVVIDAPDAPVVADAQINGIRHRVATGKSWERWNMAMAAGKPPPPPPRYPPLVPTQAAGSQMPEGEQPLILTLADSKRVLAPPMRPMGSRSKGRILIGVYLTAEVNQTWTRPIVVTYIRSNAGG